MKYRVILLLFMAILPLNLFGEVIGVPGYNYSIFPLEGWELQPYESDHELSWLSERDNIILTLSAWAGDRFPDITTMFNEIESNLSAYGDCVKFNYLEFEGAIGEVGFILNDREYKGWMIFLNGEEHDFHFLSYTLLENYEGCYNEIQSVLDSFSYGDAGQYNPGPISAFLNESPSKVVQNHTLDFFDHPLSLAISDYDFSTAQSVIEREATIMTNYSNDPDLFYEAWKRYYQIIFRDNYSRLDPLFNALYPYFANDKYDDQGLTEILMFWIQGYTYERSLESKSDLLNPLEASAKKLGDCDARSLILGILLHKFGIESLLLTSNKVKHAILAVDCPGEGYKYSYNDKDYIGVELTTKALIGEIKESITDPALWTPVEMEYTNGF